MKIEALKNIWDKAFLDTLSEESVKSLGDRSLYIGSSDIGSCPRRVFLTKTQPNAHSIEQGIVFQRGHLAESATSSPISA